MNMSKHMMFEAHIFNNHFMGQANQGYKTQQNASTPAYRIRDIMRIKPHTFHGTKVDDDQQGFIYEVFKVVDAMGVTPSRKKRS